MLKPHLLRIRFPVFIIVVPCRDIHGGGSQLKGQLDIIHPTGELQHVRQDHIKALWSGSSRAQQDAAGQGAAEAVSLVNGPSCGGTRPCCAATGGRRLVVWPGGDVLLPQPQLPLLLCAATTAPASTAAGAASTAAAAAAAAAAASGCSHLSCTTPVWRVSTCARLPAAQLLCRHRSGEAPPAAAHAHVTSSSKVRTHLV